MVGRASCLPQSPSRTTRAGWKPALPSRSPPNTFPAASPPPSRSSVPSAMRPAFPGSISATPRATISPMFPSTSRSAASSASAASAVPARARSCAISCCHCSKPSSATPLRPPAATRRRKRMRRKAVHRRPTPPCPATNPSAASCSWTSRSLDARRAQIRPSTSAPLRTSARSSPRPNSPNSAASTPAPSASTPARASANAAAAPASRRSRCSSSATSSSAVPTATAAATANTSLK